MSIEIPSVLSVQRGTIVSDGILSSIIPIGDGKPETTHVRVKVVRHGIRGTLPEKTKDGVSNPQRTESAKTHPDAIGVAVDFSFRTIPAKALIFNCSDKAYRQALQGFIDRFFVRGVPEFDEVCRRYARNILNGRWLWRNRVLGEPQVTATFGNKTYSGQGSNLKDFENYTADEMELASDMIASGLIHDRPQVAKVTGRVLFGFAGEVEVFPSQNMVTNKPKGFARSLYKMDMISRSELNTVLGTARKDGSDAGEFAADMIDMGFAALRDQKIGNAIRTIDTWYPEFESNGRKPIPVEPNGANLDANELFRAKGGAKDLLKFVDELKPSVGFDPRAAYLIALLVRGGVFSEK